MKKLFLAFIAFVVCITAMATTKTHNLTISSPDGKLVFTLNYDRNLRYRINYADKELIKWSDIGMQISRNGKAINTQRVLKTSATKTINQTIDAVVYKKSHVKDHYNTTSVTLSGNMMLDIRVYDDGAAWRFRSTSDKQITVENETVDFCFAADYDIWTPYVRSKGSFEKQFKNSFENTYTHEKLSNLDPKRLAFLPIVIDAGNGLKAVIAESDLENYPGMYPI